MNDSTFGRREFVKRVALATPLILGTPGGLVAGVPSEAPATGGRASRPREAELAADLVIIGGGLGGCAAALSAARITCASS